MKKETYQRLNAWIRKHPYLTFFLRGGNALLTGIVMMAYPALLIWMFFRRDAAVLVRAILVPLDGFILVTAFRILLGAKRPYEVFDGEPLIPKNTKGKSFPSRHVFSVFVIAMTYLAFAPPVYGVLLLAAGVFLAAARVLCGVHFPRDVIAGMLCGIAAGVIGYCFIPM